MGKLTATKAKKILRDKSVRGHPLTRKQKRFMGFIAGGGTPTRQKKAKRARRTRQAKRRT